MSFEELLLGEETKIGDCSFTVTVQAPNKEVVIVHENVGVLSAPGTVTSVKVSHQVLILGLPLEDMDAACVVFVEFRSSSSVLCWAVSDLNTLFQASAREDPAKTIVNMPLYAKPILFENLQAKKLLNYGTGVLN